MKIAIIPNMEKSGAAEIVKAVVKRLKDGGAEVYMSQSGFNTNLVQEDMLYEICDIIITVGGDGTLIRYAKNAAVHSKAVLGINAGRLGFLADVERDRLDLLDRLCKGDYEVSYRLMLEAKVYSGEKLIAEQIALNDAVLAPGGIARLLDLEVKISDDTISYRADGVIVSTPTGSTAYSMSAGGPIIDPSVRCMSVTPICSHSLTARPIIVDQESLLEIKLPNGSDQKAIFSLDGRFCCEVDKDTVITVRRAPFDAKLINLSGNAIYKTLSLKF